MTKAEQFEKVTRDNDFHDDSYFEVTFDDGSVRDERDLNWSAISTLRTVSYKDSNRAVFECTEKVKHIKIVHNELSTEFDIPDDCTLFQSVHSTAVYSPGGGSAHRVVGRYVGLIKNDRIIEERFLNDVEGIVSGFKE